jgi:hypothetical protein
MVAEMRRAGEAQGDRGFHIEDGAACAILKRRLGPQDETRAVPNEPEPENEWRNGFPCEACRWQDERKNRRWCGTLDVLAADALAQGGECGPTHKLLEPLK